MKIKKLITGDGSDTLYNPEIGDHYHSVFGAVEESSHIYINSAYNYFNKKSLNVLEIGFGTGLNAILTCIESKKKRIHTIYHSLELYPLGSVITDNLNYSDIFINDKNIIKHIHSCRWEEECRIDDYFVLKKIKADILSYSINEKYDLVYYDAFGPDKQALLWTKEIFSKIFNSLNNGGILTTFSVKGIVKRALKASGFNIHRLPGPSGKRHIIRAEKP
ncbi:tRNA (5-methylaminomethyl-2-thiouridine)(34)-methyltransferase MnmD [Bacteroidota bacterium]